MAKSTSTSPDEVRTSVASIYSDLLDKRRADREAKDLKKQQEREEREKEKEAKKRNDDGSKKSKEERRQEELEAWKEILVGLTGDDLDYASPKKKKKYRKWIGEEDGTTILTPKPKKKKKRNYRKEFEPELNMLKNIVADQNRFSNELMRRFQNAAGPATKDAMPLNKTLVELASAINSSRQNSLGMIREIGNLKKTIAELYMKQAKNDAESNSTGFDARDVGLMGSSVASMMIGDASQGGGNPSNNAGYTVGPVDQNTMQANRGPIQVTAVSTPTTDPSVEEDFDPSTWGGPNVDAGVNYENTPKSIVVEWHKSENRARFKAVSLETGEELIGCPVPTSDPSKLTFNEKDLIVKGEFDESYKLEIV